MADPVSDLERELAQLPAAERIERLRAEIESLSLPERFELLHRLGVYHHPESYSGAASAFEETAALREALPRIIKEHQVATMLDIPCGDFAWMRHVPLAADYTGADVVAELVSENQQRYGNERRRFVVLDATRDALPQVDLILSRDLRSHRSNRDCRAALANYAASGARLLLTNHFAGRAENPDIVSGDFRPINLTRPPFHLPPPLEILSERSNLGDGAFADRSMALWRLAEIAQSVADE